MASGAFFYPDSDIPQMSVEEIRDTMEAIDNRAYFDFLHCVPSNNRADKKSILEYLVTHEPALYDTLEAILKTYQTAFFQACEARNSLIKCYQRFRVARDMADAGGRDVVQEIIEAAEIGEAPKKKKNPKKRRQPEQEEAENAQLLESVQATAKVLRQSIDPSYYAQEKFSSEFPFRDYVHFVPKGTTRWNLQELDSKGIWETIYHVTGPWKAEELKEQLENEGKKAIIIKRARGSMDQEVMSYKVLSGY